MGTTAGALRAHAIRRLRAGPDPWEGLVGIDELRAEALPGECLFCGSPCAPKVTKPHLTCGSIACRRVYLKLHKRLSRSRQAASFDVSRGGVTPHPEPSFR